MNQEMKKEWVAALRSGKFKQGKGVLRNKNDEYCCMRVACEIHRNHHPDIEWLNCGSNFSFLGNRLFFPKDMQKEWGYKHGNFTKKQVESIVNTDKHEKFFPKTTGFSLVSFNDSGYSFNEIADIIEKLM